jgi:site-specific DNA-methyltransferase (adenine-specific)
MREEIIGNQRLMLGDCRDFVAGISADVFLTDPFYGVDGGRGGQSKDGRGKAGYNASWEDTPEAVADVVVPVITTLSETLVRGAITPGSRCMLLYPKPVDIGCFWTPAASNLGPWGFTTFTPIFYYGKDHRAGKGPWPTGMQLTERSPKNGHPCPKPVQAWTWLLEKVALPTDIVLDPFLGSGTTLVCCENTGRRGIGIEIEPKFFDIACREVEKATQQPRLDMQVEVVQTGLLFEEMVG